MGNSYADRLALPTKGKIVREKNSGQQVTLALSHSSNRLAGASVKNQLALSASMAWRSAATRRVIEFSYGCIEPDQCFTQVNAQII